MISLKKGVNITGIRIELVLALMIVDRVYERHGYDAVLTSGLDSRHSDKSLHYCGAAADLRTRQIPRNLVVKIGEEMKTALGRDFDVVVESNHIHLEWQPRRPM